MPSKKGKDSWLSYQITKSGFFHQKLHQWGLLEIAYDLEKIKGEDLDWVNLNISEKAWKKVIHNGIKPVRTFAHPSVLSGDSKRISYYRMLSMVSQKSMGNVGLGINGYEIEGKTLDSNSALKIAQHLNSIICMLIEVDEVIDEREFDLWRGMAAGAQAQGSSQNAIGKVAEDLVKNLVLDRIKEKGLVADLPNRGKSKELKLSDGRILTMGSEPDIAVMHKNGHIHVAVEIKGGIDTAGVLERFGATTKSLDRAKQENPDSITVLILHEASLTETANGEIERSKSIDHMFTIGELMSKEEEKIKLFEIMGI